MPSAESHTRVDPAPGRPPPSPILRTGSWNFKLAAPGQRATPQATGRVVDNPKAIEDKWTWSLNESNTGKDFEDSVKALHDEFISALKNADKEGEGAREETCCQISRFLCADVDEKGSGDKKDRNRNLDDRKDGSSAVDDCVRWVMLYVAVGGKKQHANQEKALMEIILGQKGYLAFENLNQGSIKKKCRAKEQNHEPGSTYKANKKTIFQNAAEFGNAWAVQLILRLGREFCNKIRSGATPPRTEAAYWDNDAKNPETDLLLHIAEQEDSSGGTVLSFAAGANEDSGVYKTLGILLSELPGLVEKGEVTFDKALKKDTFAIVKEFLKTEAGQRRFAKSTYIIKAMAGVTKGDEEGPEKPRMGIVRKLLELAEPSEKFHIQVLGELINLGLINTWKEKIAKDMPDEVEGRLLHLAVLRRKPEFVEMFLKEYPGLVSKRVGFSDLHQENDQGKDYYPLWYNNKSWDGSKREWVDADQKWVGSKEFEVIRSSIAYHTIRSVDRMQNLLRIFQQSGEPAKELCFDLSRFDSKRFLVSDFVKSLTHHENRKLVKYEETIRYAEFPALGLHAKDKETLLDNAYLAAEHTEVFDILDWLHRGEKVQNIVSLKVPDRLINPHSEKGIAEEVKKFKVEILDWRFLDMSISIFEQKEVRERITELHLYASGKHAPISHWLSDHGVQSLKNLSKLYVHVVKEMGTEKSCEFTVAYLKRELGAVLRPEVKIYVTAEFWNREPKLPNLNEVTQRVAPKLSQFIESYLHLAHERHKQNPKGGFRPIKVAIIDNGILSIVPKTLEKSGGLSDGRRSPHGRQQQQQSDEENSDGDWADFVGNGSLSSRIALGNSFVDENFRLSPWHFASNPHGTQMANLICAMDPLCKLYVAKVADGMNGMTPIRVARAIEWAISEGVNIISMSFTMLDGKEELSGPMTKAAGKGIVMLCSSHDEGSRVVEVWPAAHISASNLVIAACDKYGKPIRDMDPGQPQYNYKVEGVDVPAGVIPFLDSSDRISGSSVATALVAGLSSLILSCHRLARPNGPRHDDPKDAIDVVKKYLGMMNQKGDASYLFLERFANIDDMVKEGEGVEAKKVLKDKFGMRDDIPDIYAGDRWI